MDPAWDVDQIAARRSRNFTPVLELLVALIPTDNHQTVQEFLSARHEANRITLVSITTALSSDQDLLEHITGFLDSYKPSFEITSNVD